MSNISVEIPDFEREDFLFMPGEENCSETTLVVRPPIIVGELFEETILGQEPLEVSLKHIITTEDATILEARIGAMRDKQERVRALKEIASRITVLAAFPGEATFMHRENPFIQRHVSVNARHADLKSALQHS